MFCSKCGTQLEKKALFCHKCGAKISDVNVDKEISDPVVKDQKQRSGISSEVLHQGGNVMDNDMKSVGAADQMENKFRDYINEHVRKTTEFETAEDLLNSKVPQKFIRIYFGVSLILLFILFLGEPSFGSLCVIFFMFGFMVYPIGLLVDYIFSFRAKGGESKTRESINTDELIAFLNSNLAYLSTYFGEWSYIKMVGYGMKGAMVAAAQNAMMGTRVGTEFGEKKSCFVEIHISPDHANLDSGKTVYFFSASMRSILRPWPARYVCMVKAAPVLRAAMEYYLKEYKSEEKEASANS